MDSDRWIEGSASEFPHERQALAYLRNGLPNHDPYRSWSNVEFIDSNGRLNEVDAIVVTPKGLFLIEIKSWPGKLFGDSLTWRTERGQKDNPYRLANAKAKRLKSLMDRNWPNKHKVPFVEALVFLSDLSLDCRLHPDGRVHTFGRKDAIEASTNFKKLPDILDAVINPDSVGIRGSAINSPTSKAVAAAFAKAGIRASNKARKLGDYDLHEVLDEGSGWQDLRATRAKHTAEWRARIYLTHRTTSADESASLTELAEREARVLDGVKHPGVTRPLGAPTAHEFGPALLFDRNAGEQRADLWVAEHLGAAEPADRVDMADRVDLVAQLADAVRFAHGKGLTHGRLSPRSVLIWKGESGWELGVGHWYSSSREFDDHTTRLAMPDQVDQFADVLYLAPEIDAVENPDRVAMDSFGVGAIAHLLLTGNPIATSLAARAELFNRQTGADPKVFESGVPDGLALAVTYCTEPLPGNRMALAELFAEARIAPAPNLNVARIEVDPRSARPGDVLDGGAVVLTQLGKGSTAVALLVDWNGAREVFKVALDEDRAELIKQEHEALKTLNHERVVNMIGLTEISGCTVLRLSSASDIKPVGSGFKVFTLADRLREDGRPAPDVLARWGTDLLEAVAYLEGVGIAHRDIKPDNLGVRQYGSNRMPHLVLFDFSLTRLPADVITAGTLQYLDPFLGERVPQRWDSAAERYAAAITLFEMATGRRPLWGDGRSAPMLLPDTLPNIDPGLFDDELQAELAAFFKTALQRNPDDRFHTADEMRSAWRRVFSNPTSTTSLDPDPPSAEEIQAALISVTLETPAVSLPLSGLAKASLARLGINSAGDLATYPAMSMSNTSGIGSKVRHQLRDLGKALRQRFDSVDQPTAEIGVAVGGTALLKALVPESADHDLARATLGLHERSTGPWPPRSEALTILDLDKEAFAQGKVRLRRRWLDIPQLTLVRDRLILLLDEAGGIASGAELAEQVIGQLGFAAPRERRARASRAIVLAALEADRGLDRPKFSFRMAGRALIVSGHGDDNDEAVDWASQLGAEADELCRQWPLAQPKAVIDQLRALTPAPGIAPLSDARLVALAAAASNASAVSSRLELYPKGMEPERAIQAARAALLGRGTLGVTTVQSRVMGRFSQAADLPGRPKLDELLEPFGLVWNPPGTFDHPDGGYSIRSPEHITGTRSTATQHSTGLPAAVGDDAMRAINDDLAAIKTAGGYRVLTVTRPDVADAESRLHDDGFVVISLEERMLVAMRKLCVDRKIDWSTTVLRTDAEGPDQQRNWNNLINMANEARGVVEAQLLSEKHPVVLTRLGLAARYGQLTDLLAHLAEATRVPSSGQSLTTLAVLVVSSDRTSRPKVEAQVVPLQPGHPHYALTTKWLKRLEGQPA
jgi:serine/threonine protein kinase